jgi:hypothetical protein
MFLRSDSLLDPKDLEAIRRQIVHTFLGPASIHDAKEQKSQNTNAFVTNEPTDLTEYPEINTDKSQQLTIGDLHANALKFFHFLVKEGIFEVTKEDYEKVVKIYKMADNNPEQLNKEIISDFNAILGRVKTHAESTVRIIGDELADRGANDYFILKILERLKKPRFKDEKPVNLEILLSNHGIEFIKNSTYTSKLGKEQARSLYNLGILKQENIVEQKEIDTIIADVYKPHLKLLSYTINDQAKPPTITIYTHAPVGLETLWALAEKFKINHTQSDTITNLSSIIDQINHAFSQKIAGKSQAEICQYQHYLSALLSEGYAYFNGSPVPTKANGKNLSVCRALWNRGDDDESIDPGGNHIHFVHGHDGAQNEPPTQFPQFKGRVTNLDNTFGKYPNDYTGQYQVLHSNEISTPTAEMTASSKQHTLPESKPRIETSVHSEKLEEKRPAKIKTISTHHSKSAAKASTMPFPTKNIKSSAKSQSQNNRKLQKSFFQRHKAKIIIGCAIITAVASIFTWGAALIVGGALLGIVGMSAGTGATAALGAEVIGTGSAALLALGAKTGEHCSSSSKICRALPTIPEKNISKIKNVSSSLTEPLLEKKHDAAFSIHEEKNQLDKGSSSPPDYLNSPSETPPIDFYGELGAPLPYPSPQSDSDKEESYNYLPDPSSKPPSVSFR